MKSQNKNLKTYLKPEFCNMNSYRHMKFAVEDTHFDKTCQISEKLN